MTDPKQIADSAYACRFYAPQLRSKSLEEAADLLEAIASDLAAERDRAEKAEAERDDAIAEAHATGAERDRWKADRDRLAKELAEARAFITRVADVEWQADEPTGVLWCPGEDAKAYVAELEHHCNWTVKEARDLLALTKGDTP